MPKSKPLPLRGMTSALFSLFFIFAFCPLPAAQQAATALLSPSRPDIAAKYIYAKLREWDADTTFGRDIYYRHLQVWNNFWEYDPPKRGFEDFQSSFDALLDSIKAEGVLPEYARLPIGTNGILCNGAHRLAACLLYRRPVATEVMPYSCSPWDLGYFKGQGLEEKYLDAIALQYCELQPDTRMMLLFPAAEGKEELVKKIISAHATVVYEKAVYLTPNGGFNLILTAYENEPFVQEGRGCGDYVAGVKARQCFPPQKVDGTPLRIFLLQCPRPSSLKLCKDRIRRLYGIGHDAVHTTDTHDEAVVLARTLFNKNSLHHLNHASTSSTPLFDLYFDRYRRWLSSSQTDAEWFCIDASAVLSAYGLRDCRDLDFIHHGSGEVATGDPYIGDHNHHAAYHVVPVDEIIFNPDNHFYYRGVKFCSLGLIRAMKERRGEPKDRVDVDLIDAVLP